MSARNIFLFETILSDELLHECESASKAELDLAMLLSTYMLGSEASSLYSVQSTREPPKCLLPSIGILIFQHQGRN